MKGKPEAARILAGTPVCMVINDKTVNENTDGFGEIFEAAKQIHHFTDYMRFIIAEKNVWCMNGLTDKVQRNELAQSLSTRH